MEFTDILNKGMRGGNEKKKRRHKESLPKVISELKKLINSEGWREKEEPSRYYPDGSNKLAFQDRFGAVRVIQTQRDPTGVATRINVEIIMNRSGHLSDNKAQWEIIFYDSSNLMSYSGNYASDEQKILDPNKIDKKVDSVEVTSPNELKSSLRASMYVSTRQQDGFFGNPKSIEITDSAEPLAKATYLVGELIERFKES